MFEKLKIRLWSHIPSAKVSDGDLHRIIRREFPATSQQVFDKLTNVKSSTKAGKNRYSAAILKLSNGDVNRIDGYIELSNKRWADIVLEAEHPGIKKHGVDEIPKQQLKQILLNDWKVYSQWLRK